MGGLPRAGGFATQVVGQRRSQPTLFHRTTDESDYFLARSVDALKPAGVLVLVASHFTLDKQNAAIREHLDERADFLGAIRLPSDAFKRGARRW